MNRLTAFFAGWAIVASIALAWVVGRNTASQSPAPTSSPSANTLISSASSATRTPAVVPSRAPAYPQYVSTIPKAFRGNWDEMIADKCAGREARFYFGERTFANFEVEWEVTRVKLYSPTEMDMSTTMKDENANQVDQVWQFKLVDGGRTLTGRKQGAEFYKRCPAG